ncbi:MAG: peptidoglycan DD-metalloendopeptidase family protein [Bacteroidetes bacterium]|nr:peptidoglycan DD-metalloendopeptidase family protein [Bacteroidota bacterium]
MPKVKYKFNPESLSYNKIELSPKQRLFRSLTYIIASVFVAMLLNFAYGLFFDTPKEKGLKREINELLAQYDILNKRLAQLEIVLDDMQQRDDNIYRTIFSAEPIPKSLRDAGFGGSNRYAELESMDNSDIVVNTATRLDKITKQVYVQSISYDEIVDLAENKEKLLKSVPAIQPVSNSDLRRTASGWGYRLHPIYKIRKFHYGMDFTAPTGTEIYATGDGVIKDTDRSKRGYGNKVVIDHGYGYQSLYAHMQDFNVRQGQKVKRGDVIGYVGNTGLSTAPHLHYEVIVNGKKVNPVNYYFNDLSPAEFDRMIELSNKAGQSFD